MFCTNSISLFAGEAVGLVSIPIDGNAGVGLASIPIDGNTGGNGSQSSSLWNVVRRALKQGPVTSWPAVENKTYPLSQPRKMVCFIPILLLQISALTVLELLKL